MATGCFDEPPDTSAVVFTDDYAAGVVYQAFAKSKLDAAAVDTAEHYNGTASLRYSVPTPGEAGAGEFNFAGGAFTSAQPRDLSKFTAITFWAKASRAVAIDSIGIGNDNTGTSLYQTESNDLALTTQWTQYVLPIPAPSKEASERGLFWLAAGAPGDPAAGYQAWFDDVRFENLDAAAWNPRPILTPSNKGLDIGATYTIAGTQVGYTVPTGELTVKVSPAVFDYKSSNPAVATVSATGVVTATGNGTAVITAKLGGVDVPQSIAVTVPAPALTQMDLPVTFDSPTVDYGLLGFAGAEDSSIVGDPTGGSNLVAKVVRSAGSEVYAGTTLTKDGTIGFANKIPFTAGATTMTVRVYSAKAGVPVRLKVEDHTNSAMSVETEATTTLANTWETLTFDFANNVAGTPALNLANTYDKATIFYDFGKSGATAGAETFYFDDVAFGGGGGGSTQMDLPVTFDSTTVEYGLLGFGGADDSTIVVDPTGGTNKVARVARSATAETYAGTTLTAAAMLGFKNKVPFATGATTLTVRVYSPAAGIPVRLKVEDHTDNTVSVETEATTTAANTWETLTFDFANQVSGTGALDLAKTYDKATIFFNFGKTGAQAGAQLFYFDDMAFGGGGAPSQMDLPVTFDSSTVDYGLVGFGGADDSTIVVDPTGGTNKVGRVARSATAETWAGTTLTASAMLGFKTKIPFATGATTMTLRVYSPAAGIPVRLKVEDHSDNTVSVETEATTTAANTWETLTFDVANQASGTAALDLAKSYDKATVFFNFGKSGAQAGAQTFYFDDMAFGGGSTGPSQMDLPVTFDSSTVDYGLVGFGGADDSTIVVDPTGGTNKVGRVARSATAETWAGTTLTASAMLGFKTKIPFATGATTMKVRVYAPAAGIPVRLKVENHSDNTMTVETEATTTVANTWETLTFDFAHQAGGTAALNLASTYDKATIFFNFGTAGTTAGAQVYYFDDLEFGGTSTGGGSFTTLTFDDAAVTYTLTGFGDVAAAKVADPTSAANQVAQVVKPVTAPTWAGVTVSTGPNNTVATIPLTLTATTMTVRVYSPDIGIPVRLKVEDAGDPTHSTETEALTTVANTWETLTFDFAHPATGAAGINPAYTYNRASLFFNFGTDGATAGAKTYYFDDVTFGGGTTPPPSFATITFDDAAVTYTLTGFGDVAANKVADPTNAANQVAQVVKPVTAPTWAGVTVSTGANNTVATIPLTLTATKMSVRVYSPDIGIPVRLKVEDANDPTHSTETEALTTVANAWQTLTFDFATPATGAAAINPAYTYNRASLFFNFGTDGATAGAKTYYFDDLAFGGGSTGGGSFAPITFDDGAITYGLTGFGDVAATKVADPTNAANQVVQVVKPVTAPLWAGVTLSTGANNTVPTIPVTATSTKFTLRVYSPDAGIPVRLKLEDANDPTHSVETEATVTVAGGWQTLNFDVKNQAAGTAPLNASYTFNRVSVFCNFGTDGATAGAKTYYIDDLAFVP
ncbi:MAG: hypothetical protein K8W52_36135 [Deltaproteobacteria bacterium]|nr:hypothetical protein [Deltaproteobacteria bacterium]